MTIVSPQKWLQTVKTLLILTNSKITYCNMLVALWPKLNFPAWKSRTKRYFWSPISMSSQNSSKNKSFVSNQAKKNQIISHSINKKMDLSKIILKILNAPTKWKNKFLSRRPRMMTKFLRTEAFNSSLILKNSIRAKTL